jgi:chaperone modulatory protein CbpM
MTIERTEVVWLSARSDYSVDEVAEMSGLPVDLLETLAESGALPTRSIGGHRTTICFASESITLARAAGRIRDHFELDEPGLAVALSLLRRVRSLEARLAEVQATGTQTRD